MKKSLLVLLQAGTLIVLFSRCDVIKESGISPRSPRTGFSNSKNSYHGLRLSQHTTRISLITKAKNGFLYFFTQTKCFIVFSTVLQSFFNFKVEIKIKQKSCTAFHVIRYFKSDINKRSHLGAVQLGRRGSSRRMRVEVVAAAIGRLAFARRLAELR